MDGKVVHDAPVEPDLEFMIDNFLENRDRRLLYVAEIPVEVPEKKEGARCRQTERRQLQ